MSGLARHGVTPEICGMFGKLPMELDFVRIGHNCEEAILLDRFLQAALLRLTAAGVGWPQAPLRLALSGTHAQHALVAAVASSCDRAGRQFPIAVYQRVSLASDPIPSTAHLVLASGGFLTEAEALLARASALPTSALLHQLAGLPRLQQGELRQAEQTLTQALDTLSLARFAGPLFPAQADLDAEGSALAALQQLRSLRSRTGLRIDAYDCPVATVCDVGVWAHWIEVAHDRPASYLWSVAPQPRLLLMSGVLAERAPLYWATPNKRHGQLRTLITPEHCHESNNQRAAVSGSMPLTQVFEELENT